MTEKELRQAADRVRAIDGWRERLKTAEETLRLVNKYGKDGNVWKPTLLLVPRDGYGNREISVNITVPFGVIQQQAVYEVEAARRQIVKLGGKL